MFSGATIIPDIPEYYRKHPVLRFIAAQQMPWRESKTLAGEIGEYIVMARQAADGAWLVGAATNEAPRELDVPLSFLPAGKHEALIIQDGVAHNEGLGANWKTRRAFWTDRAANEEALRTNLLSLATTRTRHVGDDPNAERYDPDLWTDEFYFLNQPGQAQIQSDLFYDYRTNVDAYPKWQGWMHEKQPRLLVIWGKHDLSFDPGEPERYRKDVPKAIVHILDAGHFALDTKADEIAAIVREFMKTQN